MQPGSRREKRVGNIQFGYSTSRKARARGAAACPLPPRPLYIAQSTRQIAAFGTSQLVDMASVQEHSSPIYVYKIVPCAPPEPFPAEYPLSDLDKNDGFVHLSTGSQVWNAMDQRNLLLMPHLQVPLTADRFFNDTSSLWLIKFELANLTSLIKWEGGFPHLYGNFGAKDVHSTHKCERAENQSWTRSLRSSPWLE